MCIAVRHGTEISYINPVSKNKTGLLSHQLKMNGEKRPRRVISSFCDKKERRAIILCSAGV